MGHAASLPSPASRGPAGSWACGVEKFCGIFLENLAISNSKIWSLRLRHQIALKWSLGKDHFLMQNIGSNNFPQKFLILRFTAISCPTKL